MDEPQKHAKWKNPDLKDISVIILWEMERISVIIWGWKWVWEFWGKISILKFNCGSDIIEYMPAANSS